MTDSDVSLHVFMPNDHSLSIKEQAYANTANFLASSSKLDVIALSNQNFAIFVKCISQSREY